MQPYLNTKSTVFYLPVIYYHPHAAISVMYAWGWCCIALYRILELKNRHGKPHGFFLLLRRSWLGRSGFIATRSLKMDHCGAPSGGTVSCLRTMPQGKCSPEIREVISENRRTTNRSRQSIMSLQCRSSLRQTRRCRCQMVEEEL